ncbi:cytochrome P450 [Cyathus striatus]|nr:cytochrome P450 [Cyathus striatus]
MGGHFGWHWHDYVHEKYGENTVTVPLLQGPPVMTTSNLEVIKQLIGPGTTHKTEFRKSSQHGPLGYWSPNLFSTEGDAWRKHRRILGPAFNNDLFKLVWEESSRTYRRLCSSSGWDTSKAVEINTMQDITFKFALLIIGKCGFGFDWADALPTAGDSSETTIHDALHTVLDGSIFLGVVPKVFLSLPIGKIKNTLRAADQLEEFLKIKAREKQAEFRSETDAKNYRKDVFTLLVRANEESGKNKLTDEELIGNMFLMLFAGHETTATVLSVAAAYLARYPEIQEQLHKHIISVIGTQGDADFSCYSKLDQVQAVFYEALRMYPPGFVIIREVKEDTQLNIPNPVGQEGSTIVPVPKDTRILIDMVSLQYNPRYFYEPQKFKPSRWQGTGDAEPETLTAFSIGPRTCIGRKFAIIEGVCFLSMLLREWRLEPLLQAGESKESWTERVFQAAMGPTLGIAGVSVSFVRRDAQ